MSGNPEGIKRPKGQFNMSTKVTIVSQPTNKPLHTCFTLSWCMFSPLYITIIINVFRLHLLLLSLLHNPLQGRRRRAVLIRVTTNERQRYSLLLLNSSKDMLQQHHHNDESFLIIVTLVHWIVAIWDNVLLSLSILPSLPHLISLLLISFVLSRLLHVVVFMSLPKRLTSRQDC